MPPRTKTVRPAEDELNDHVANEDEGLDQFEDDDSDDGDDDGPAADADDDEEDDEPAEITERVEDRLKRPVGELLSAIALQGVSSHAKKRPISALSNGWIQETWSRLTALLSEQRDAAEAPAWRNDVRHLEAEANERELDLFATRAVQTTRTKGSIDAAPSTPLEDGEFRVIDIDALRESPRNPRKHFDQGNLDELAASVRELGVLTPLLARPSRVVLAYGEASPTKQMYELAAGHRRFRAAKIAGLTRLPVLVRPMTDVQLLEVLTIENLQRRDVHPLEEAQGYRDLIKDAHYTVQRIADRIAMSPKYVYDRIKLLDLNHDLADLFLEKKISAAHAILLARLNADDQDRAAAYPNGGLWAHEDGAQLDLADAPPEVLDDIRPGGTGTHLKLRSVRELAAWIETYVRFDPADIDPMLFPETAAAIPAAIERAEKVVHITTEYHVHPDAKDPGGARTIGPQSWKRAVEKPCEYAVTGVVVVGDGRGQAFAVCTEKKKCKTHWAAEMKHAAQMQRSRESLGTTQANVAQRQKQDEQRRAAQEAAAAAFDKAKPAIASALAARFSKLSVEAAAKIVTDETVARWRKIDGMKPGKSADAVLRYLAFQIIGRQMHHYSAESSFPSLAKRYGVDVAKIIKGAAPEKPAKAKASKKGRR